MNLLWIYLTVIYCVFTKHIYYYLLRIYWCISLVIEMHIFNSNKLIAYNNQMHLRVKQTRVLLHLFSYGEEQ